MITATLIAAALAASPVPDVGDLGLLVYGREMCAAPAPRVESWALDRWAEANGVSKAYAVLAAHDEYRLIRGVTIGYEYRTKATCDLARRLARAMRRHVR